MKDKDIHNFASHHRYIKKEFDNFLNGTLSEKEQEYYKYFSKDICDNIKVVTEDNNYLILIPEEEKYKIIKEVYYNPKFFNIFISKSNEIFL